MGRLRYAIAARGHPFASPRTLAPGIHSDGKAQVLTTPDGDVIIAGDANARSVHILTPASPAFATIRVLDPARTTAALERVATGPGGLGAALCDELSPDGPNPGVGAVRALPGGGWGPPTLIDATSPVLDIGPVVSLPGDGATVLGWGTAPTTSHGTSVTVGLSNIEVAVAEPGGAFGAPVELVGHLVDDFNDLQMAPFGNSTAVLWGQRSTKTTDLVRAAVRAPRSPFGPPRTLGRADPHPVISLAAAGSTAVAGWLRKGHVHVAIATAQPNS